MYGAIIGDIAGSRFEHKNFRSKDFVLFTPESRFTDDTVCTIATMDWLNNGDNKNYSIYLRKWYKKYPKAGYSRLFSEWAKDVRKKAYGSYGNGSAMRVSPIGIFGDIEPYVLAFAEKSSVVSHDHIDAINGAQAIALAVMLAKHKEDKAKIKETIENKFGYNLDYNYENLVVENKFDTRSKTTVPLAVYCFLISNSFEDAIRTAISIGGDSDTIANMTGSIAGEYYKIPNEIKDKALTYLTSEMKTVLTRFKRLLEKKKRDKIIAQKRFVHG